MQLKVTLQMTGEKMDLKQGLKSKDLKLLEDTTINGMQQQLLML